MPRKGHTAEQIISILRQVEVEQSKGKSVEEACREAQVAPHTYYNWRKKYGGMKVDEAKRLKELEKENARLKHLVADLTLDKQMLQEVLKGNF
jgi:transposase-like protein